MMSFKRVVLGGLLAVASMGVYSFVAVDDPLAKISRQLDKWVTERPVEKVYLHLDKPYYAAGDDIWFKAYVTAGSYNQLTALSGIVNIELLDAQNAIKQSVKLELQNGVAWGDFALPDTLRSGAYHIRAYTNYMRNAGSEYFFDKDISIINALGFDPQSSEKTGVQKGRATNLQAPRPDVQFFPEGGALVAGVPARVAFKAVAPTGSGIDVKGIITDNSGRQIAEFSTAHLGMGAFSFTPQAGNTYAARVTFPDASVATVPLPQVAERGYVLTVSDTDPQSLRINIAGSRSVMNTGQELTLVGQNAGKIYFTGKSRGGEITIAKNKLPTGIVQFTLFSAAGEPLNERLVFIRNPDRLDMTVTSARQSYAPREKVKLSINATNRGNKPAVGSFSVAVTDETRVPVDEANDNSILASLLLTSDLRGYVEQPDYYFNNVSDKTRADLDLLMLTQGYHRFEWKDIMNDKFAPAVYQPERTLRIAGTLTTPSGKPVGGGKVKVINFDDISFELDTVTDAQGRFSFADLTFADSVRFIVQARDAKNKRDVVINIDSIAPPASQGRPQIEVAVNDKLSVYAQSSKELYSAQRRFGVGNHVISLREVIIREKKQALKYSSNLNGPGNADQVLLAKDLRYLGCVRIGDCLQGRLLGVTFRNGIPFSTRSYRPMQVIIDGVYVDPGFLNSVNYFDVAAIEVLRNAGSVGIYGGRGGNGVIIITTKRGDEPEEYTGPISGRGIKPYYPKGYYKARAFYSPRYDKSGENKVLADLRSTVYWNPDVKLADGKAEIEYFNAGTKGVYRVVVEGIDSDGNLARRVYRYRVE